MSCHYQVNARQNRNVFSLDLNVPSESLSVTVLGREFQVAGAEQRNAHLTNGVLANNSDNRVNITRCLHSFVVDTGTFTARWGHFHLV